MLAICPDPVRLTILHEPLLPGLIDVTIHREFNEVFGIVVADRSVKQKDSETKETELYLERYSIDPNIIEYQV